MNWTHMRPKRYVLFGRFEDMYSQIVDNVNELSLNHGETHVLKPLLSPNASPRNHRVSS